MVNEIPHHERYFELFAGSAQLFDKKKRAAFNYLADKYQKQCDRLEKKYGDLVPVYNGSALDILTGWQFTRKDFIYLDPPYPESARRSDRKIYKFEMLSDADHVQLLTAILELDANIMISTSPNALYDDMLLSNGWRKKEMQCRNRVATYTEVIFMNYQTPAYLHQYDMLGVDYIERQEKTRKVKRITNKLDILQPYELHLFMQAMIKKDPAAVQHFLTVVDLK